MEEIDYDEFINNLHVINTNLEHPYPLQFVIDGDRQNTIVKSTKYIEERYNIRDNIDNNNKITIDVLNHGNILESVKFETSKQSNNNDNDIEMEFTCRNMILRNEPRNFLLGNYRSKNCLVFTIPEDINKDNDLIIYFKYSFLTNDVVDRLQNSIAHKNKDTADHIIFTHNNQVNYENEKLIY